MEKFSPHDICLLRNIITWLDLGTRNYTLFPLATVIYL